MALYTLSQVVELLEEMLVECGSQKALADKLGISQQHLNDVLSGRRLPVARLLRAVGLQKVTLYSDD